MAESVIFITPGIPGIRHGKDTAGSGETAVGSRAGLTAIEAVRRQPAYGAGCCARGPRAPG